MLTARRLVLIVLSCCSVSASDRKWDKNSNCAHWADLGECERNPGYMQTECAASCKDAVADEANADECRKLAELGKCRADIALKQCRATCFRILRSNTTEDKEGNCFYWATDGECSNNREWMATSCKRSCEKLDWCGHRPESDKCAQRFECPLERDKEDPHTCKERALRGECRSPTLWQGTSAITRCPYTCSILDPPSTSKSVTRPIVKQSPRIDPRVPRHRPGRCHHIGLRYALLSAKCPNLPPALMHVDQLEGLSADPLPSEVGERLAGADLDPVPWRRRWRRCPRVSRAHERMTPRLAHETVPPIVDLPAEAAKATGSSLMRLGRHVPPRPISVQVISFSPRVRILHNFVTEHEAAHLIKIAEPRYHRSSTARAGSDDKRTSNSAMLDSSDLIVSAVRHRIAFYAGYPVENLEPLQAVRYRPGEFYKPHHDYYNSCETWANGNRHFTFLIYLNDVEEGGETAFPYLNITVTPAAYSALVFNNCLDNGDPDERTLHEGVPPSQGIKYAINGWMRSKHLHSW